MGVDATVIEQVSVGADDAGDAFARRLQLEMDMGLKAGELALLEQEQQRAMQQIQNDKISSTQNAHHSNAYAPQLDIYGQPIAQQQYAYAQSYEQQHQQQQRGGNRSRPPGRRERVRNINRQKNGKRDSCVVL